MFNDILMDSPKLKQVMITIINEVPLDATKKQELLKTSVLV